MNYLKIQNEVLKSAYDRELKKKPFKWFYYETENELIIGIDYGFYVIPKRIAFLNVEKTFNAPPCRAFKNIIDDLREFKDVVDTGVEKTLDDFTVHIFDCGDGEEVWINKNHLKMFDLKNSTFKGKNKKSPLFIYENDVLVGAMLGVNHK